MNNISSIGIGCHKLQGGFEKKRSYKIICAALDSNINYFDTAPRYEDSEVLLGEFLKGNNEVFISSKVGLDPLANSRVQKMQSYLKREIKLLLKNNFEFAKNYLDKKLLAQYDDNINNTNLGSSLNQPELLLNESQIRSALTSSLDNLRRDYLDLYLLHEPEQYKNINEILGIFAKLKNEGLIRYYGLGFHRSLNDRDHNDKSLINLSMFNKDLMDENKKSSNLSIIHGAIAYYKYGMNQKEKNKFNGPIDFLMKLIQINPHKTFLIAPSNKDQISSLKF